MKKVLVTGGTRGIGRAIVERLAEDGYDVTFTYRESASAAQELERTLSARGRSVRGHVLDQSRAPERPDAADELRLDAGAPFYGLVVNAGIALHNPLGDITPGDFERVFATNVRGPLFLLQRLLPRLSDGGRVVFVSSASTRWPSPGEAVYAASKAALEQVCRVASRELGSRGITVNAVCPGPTRTDLLEHVAVPQALEAVTHLTALGRLGTPSDIADVISLLLDERAHWLTGQLLCADGGLT